jgi:hypothetical protein
MSLMAKQELELIAGKGSDKHVEMAVRKKILLF